MCTVDVEDSDGSVTSDRMYMQTRQGRQMRRTVENNQNV
jgi:hypothetical protein